MGKKKNRKNAWTNERAVGWMDGWTDGHAPALPSSNNCIATVARL